MAIINKTGITNGGTIQAEHITRVIDALSGGSTDTVVATGSFTGSFGGSFSGSFSGTTTSASFATTASYAVSASYEINYETSSSYAETASIAISASRATSSSFATLSQQIDVTATEFPSEYPAPTAVGFNAPNWISYTAGQPVGIVSLDFAHDIGYTTGSWGGPIIQSTSTTSITGSLRIKVFPNGDTGSAYYFTFNVPVTGSLGPAGDAWDGQIEIE